MLVLAVAHASDRSYDRHMAVATPPSYTARSVDSSPKWWTEIQFDLRNQWTESTIEHLPSVQYDDSAFTTVLITALEPAVRLSATPGE
jgi:hypothetical protein